MLAEDPEALEVVGWWMRSTTWGDFSGAPVSPPEWPLPGGELHQYNDLAEAVMLLRSEWGFVQREKPKPAKAPDPKRRR